MSPLRIDIWSDVVCPWCYIGKRRLETALGRFEHADEVGVHWHSFQLDPSHPKGHRQPVFETLAKKVGAPPAQVRAMTRQVSDLAAAEGLQYDLERAVSVNTIDAHRLGHLAAAHGVGDEMHERLLRAHLCEGEVGELLCPTRSPARARCACASPCRASTPVTPRSGAAGSVHPWPFHV